MEKAGRVFSLENELTRKQIEEQRLFAAYYFRLCKTTRVPFCRINGHARNGTGVCLI